MQPAFAGGFSVARRKNKSPEAESAVEYPKSGPWNERDSTGWTICPTHDYGIQPGTSCLRCRLDALEL